MANLVPDPVLEPTISIERAAEILGLNPRTIYNHAVAGDLPAIRVGRRVRIPTAEFLTKYRLGGQLTTAA